MVRTSAGVSLIWASPLGPIRLDYACADHQDQVRPDAAIQLLGRSDLLDRLAVQIPRDLGRARSLARPFSLLRRSTFRQIDLAEDSLFSPSTRRRRSAKSRHGAARASPTGAEARREIVARCRGRSIRPGPAISLSSTIRATSTLSKATARRRVLVAPRYAARAPAGCAALETAQPYRAMRRGDGARCSRARRGRDRRSARRACRPRAHVHPSARLEAGGHRRSRRGHRAAAREIGSGNGDRRQCGDRARCAHRPQQRDRRRLRRSLPR